MTAKMTAQELEDYQEVMDMRTAGIPTVEDPGPDEMLDACKLFIQAAGGYDGALSLLTECMKPLTNASLGPGSLGGGPR